MRCYKKKSQDESFIKAELYFFRHSRGLVSSGLDWWRLARCFQDVAQCCHLLERTNIVRSHSGKAGQESHIQCRLLLINVFISFMSEQPSRLNLCRFCFFQHFLKGKEQISYIQFEEHLISFCSILLPFLFFSYFGMIAFQCSLQSQASSCI